MPAALYLIRHGQTPDNAARRFRGPDGHLEALSETGQTEALALAQALARLDLPRPRLYASPYLRAQQTAEPIAASLRVPLQTLPGVHEIDTGDWKGRPYADVDSRVHELIAPDGLFGYPGGESLSGVAERVYRALTGLRPQDGETVLVVSHGAALVALLSRLLGRDMKTAYLSNEFQHDNTAVTELTWNGDGQHELVRLADLSHLGG